MSRREISRCGFDGNAAGSHQDDRCASAISQTRDRLRAALNQKLLSRIKRPTPMTGPNIVATTIITNDLPTITPNPALHAIPLIPKTPHIASGHARTGPLKQIQPAIYFYTKILFSSRVIPTLATFRSRACEHRFAQQRARTAAFFGVKKNFIFNEMMVRSQTALAARSFAPRRRMEKNRFSILLITHATTCVAWRSLRPTIHVPGHRA